MVHHRDRGRGFRSVAALAPIGLVAGLVVGSPTSATTNVELATGEVASDVAVEQEVLDELAADGRATFWVYLREQANLSATPGIADRADQGWFVFEELTGTAEASQAGLVSMLRAEGVRYESFWIANTVKVTGSQDLLERITALPEVAGIAADRVYDIPEPEPADDEDQVNAVEWNVDRVNAPQVWSELGVTGEGIVVATIDTGVEFDHSALVEQYRGNLGDGAFDHNYNWHDATSICGEEFGLEGPCDTTGHGTHVTGIIVGDDGGDNRIGVAPGAQWIAAKGCELATCSQAALLSAGQFILAPTDLDGNNPDPELRPHVVNNSWGGGSGTDPWFRSTVEAWVAAGIFPQFANGNTSGGAACGSSSNPGNLPESYAAGAFDIHNEIADFSNRGPSVWDDDLIKPNISAPGVAVRSSLRGDAYGAATGTSMASPHVAGAVALMWSAAPALEREIDATRDLVDVTAIDVEDLTCGGSPGNNNVWGQGRLDAFTAVEEAPRGPTGVLIGTVTDADSKEPIAGATITITGEAERQRTTAMDGTYSVLLPVGDYEVRATAFAYQSQDAPVSVVEDETTILDFPLAAPEGRGLSITPDPLDFGDVLVGTAGGPTSVTLTSTGVQPVVIGTISDPSTPFVSIGGTCATPPFTLSRLESCTLDYTFRPTMEGPAETGVTIVSNTPGRPHVVSMRGAADTGSGMERLDAIELASGENALRSVQVDPAGEFAYFATATFPGRVVKIDLGNFERVDAITLASGENAPRGSVIDPAGDFAYFGTNTLPGRVVKIDLRTFERVGAITLPSGEDRLQSAVIDPAGEFAYFGTLTSPGRVVKIDLESFERVSAITLPSGEDRLQSAVIDPAGEFAYFGTPPGRVVKIDLESFEFAGVIQLEDGETGLVSAVIDPAGEFAYFGTGNIFGLPAAVVKIDLESFERVDAITMEGSETILHSGAIDPAGRFAYFGTAAAPGRVVKIDLETFDRVGAITMETGENDLFSAVIDPAGRFVYFGTGTFPARVVKVHADIEILLSAEARRAQGMHTVDLSWDGATSAEVLIFRDGELIATVPNDGLHTDPIEVRGHPTYTYRVCQAGSCSNEATVTFRNPTPLWQAQVGGLQ